MGLGEGNTAFAEVRRENRDEVHYRARAFGPDAKPLTMLVVNLSSNGLMARCDLPYAIGDRIRLTLPAIGVLVAEIRWVLGGRIGCQFERQIDLASYYAILGAMLKR